MQGKDLIVRSKTGTGKTAAFGLPLLERIDPADKAVRALVLCPTRELALQVAAELQDLGKYKGVQVTAIYGGASMKAQEDALEAGSPIVVGTPGRVYDHIRRKNLKLEGCRHVVLDEADEMLNQGFYEEVTRILDQLPKDRQVLLFSATVPPDIQRLIASTPPRRRRCCSPATCSPSTTSTTSATTSPTPTRSRGTSSTCWRWRSRTTPSSSATPATTPRW